MEDIANYVAEQTDEHGYSICAFIGISSANLAEGLRELFLNFASEKKCGKPIDTYTEDELQLQFSADIRQRVESAIKQIYEDVPYPITSQRSLHRLEKYGIRANGSSYISRAKNSNRRNPGTKRGKRRK